MNTNNWRDLSKEDLDNLSKIYKKCQSKSIKYVKYLGELKGDAEDLFHNSIIIYINKIKDGSYKNSNVPCSYINGIIKNLWRARNRFSKKFPESSSIAISELKSSDIAKPMKREKLTSKVENLLNEIKNENQRRTLYMKFILGYSYEEICKEVGCNIQVARNRISLGTKSLRALIKTKPRLQEALKELLKDE